MGKWILKKEKVYIEKHNESKYKELLSVKKSLPKKEWPAEAQLNTAIVKCVWDEDRKHWVYITNISDKVASSIAILMDRLSDTYDISIANVYLNYEQIIYVPENINDGMGMAKLGLFGDCVNIKCKEFTLILTPYHNGINVLGLFVDNNFRNKGIGTDIMNTLYDISEERDVPIFLTPYPDENCDKSEIWDRIYRLRKWYTKLGFGAWYKMEWLWTNYEDNMIK